MDDLRKTAEGIYAQVSEPEFWGSWLLEDVRRGVDDIAWHRTNDWGVEEDVFKEGLAETMDWSGDAIKQIEWLLSIIHPDDPDQRHTFSKMLTKPVRRKPEDFGEYAQWVSQDYIDDQMHWAYAQKQGSGRRPTNEGRNFLKHWTRFVAEFTGQEVSMKSRYGEGVDPTFEETLKDMSPTQRLAFLTARTLYPDLKREDVTEIAKSGKNTPWWVDPNE